MANPVLNERTMRQASNTWAPPGRDTGYVPPVDDGPTSSWSREVMTVNGVISATATLFVLLLASAAVGWIMTGGPTEVVLADGSTGFEYGFPGLAIAGVLVGFGLAILLRFKPHLAKIIAPIYAIVEGLVVGSISRVYETYYNGIVVQAAGATVAVFAVMLLLYRTRIINVTERFRKVVVTATMGVMVFYGVSLLINLFGGSVSFLSSPSLLGIGFSVLVAGLAAFNLALDFDFIERGAKQGLDKKFEWYAAFGLLVTIIWLYLELLRLLSKLRER
jgi:uncharacterized YccA/Bax inhibitor family protein